MREELTERQKQAMRLFQDLDFDAPAGTPEEWAMAEHIHSVATYRRLMFDAYRRKGFSEQAALAMILAEIQQPEINFLVQEGE